MKKRIVSLLALLALVGVLAACGSAPATIGASSTATSAPAATATATKTPGDGHYQVGQTGKVGVWLVMVNSVKTSAGDATDTPKNGQYLILDITFQNTDTKDHTVSSLLQMTFKDSTGQKYDEQYTNLPNVTPPDGDVNGGDKVRGQVTYDVPTSQHQFTWIYAAILVPESGTWDITV